MKPTIEDLKKYIEEQLGVLAIREHLDRIIEERSSKAGTRHEEVFTREFLCPILSKFFYVEVRSELNLSENDICKGLGTEGFVNCPGFGFTPGHKSNHLFTKSDFIQSAPPDRWFRSSDKRLSTFEACPDFALRHPLPFSIVGETKYFKYGSPTVAVRELYNAARQALFYLGAFPKEYDAAMVVVADASPEHNFQKGLELLKPELVKRFGAETKIHLVNIKIA